MDTSDEPTGPAEAVEQENGEATQPPEDDGEDARRHAEGIEQHNRPTTAPTDPG